MIGRKTSLIQFSLALLGVAAFSVVAAHGQFYDGNDINQRCSDTPYQFTLGFIAGVLDKSVSDDKVMGEYSSKKPFFAPLSTSGRNTSRSLTFLRQSPRNSSPRKTCSMRFSRTLESA